MKEDVSIEVEKDLNNKKFPIKIINIDFFEYFQQFDPKTKIYDYLDESKQLSQLLSGVGLQWNSYKALPKK